MDAKSQIQRSNNLENTSKKKENEKLRGGKMHSISVFENLASCTLDKQRHCRNRRWTRSAIAEPGGMQLVAAEGPRLYDGSIQPIMLQTQTHEQFKARLCKD